MYFWYTEETIPEGVGFSHFGPLHLFTLSLTVLCAIAGALYYRSLGQTGRRRFRYTIGALMMVDEFFKDISLVVLGLWTPEYLPLHLCNINLFVCAFYALRPSKALGNYLYTVCVPGALAACLFPSWTVLPAWNFMFLHSTTCHIMLVMFPIALTAGGDIKPSVKDLPRCLLILCGLASVAAIANLIIGGDSNFFFLCYADPGNPLYVFEQAFGCHLIGFPVIISAVLLVMQTPWFLAERKRKIEN
jgi:uncharacterized membrane protein YwaF